MCRENKKSPRTDEVPTNILRNLIYLMPFWFGQTPLLTTHDPPLCLHWSVLLLFGSCEIIFKLDIDIYVRKLFNSIQFDHFTFFFSLLSIWKLFFFSLACCFFFTMYVTCRSFSFSIIFFFVQGQQFMVCEQCRRICIIYIS